MSIRANLKAVFMIVFLTLLSLTMTSVTQAVPPAIPGSHFPMYVTSFINSKIVSLDSGGSQNVFSSGGSLSNPAGIAIDSAGNLYVSNCNNVILKIDSGGTQTVFAMGGYLNCPAALAFDASGYLYVSNSGDVGPGTIVKIDNAGNQSIFTSGGNIQGNNNAGLAFDASGNLYVSCQAIARIVKVDPAGNQSIFTQGGLIFGPYGLDFDISGNLYIANNTPSSVVKVDPAGNQSLFTSGVNLFNPRGLSFDDSGDLYVTSAGNDSIIKVDGVGTQTVFASGANIDLPWHIVFTKTQLYNFSGFFPPVSNLPSINAVKAGSAIPIKFTLGGDQGFGILAAGFPVSQQVGCSSSAPINDIEETSTSGGSSLSYDALSDQYKYVWKTQSGWLGTCRQLVVKLSDNTTRTAIFQFK